MNFIECVFLDFETTGISAQESEIIEIGAIKAQYNGNFIIIDQFETFVRTVQPIPKIIQRITGITPEMLEENGILIEEASQKLRDFIGTLPVLAHHSAIEIDFLQNHIYAEKKTDMPVVLNTIWPLSLLMPNLSSYSLENLRPLFNIEKEGAHRSIKDCLDVITVFEKTKEQFAERFEDLKIFFTSANINNGWGWYFNPTTIEEPFKPEKIAAFITSEKKESLTDGSLYDLKKLKSKDEDKVYPEISQAQKNIPAEIIDDFFLNKLENTENFQIRPAQLKMSQTVREGLVEQKNFAIEAPTGTGKSFAYLLPSLLASQHFDFPIVVATHSKNLQDQLLEKDFPIVNQLLNSHESKPVQAVTVKGQENYICKRKLFEVATDLLSRKESKKATEDTFESDINFEFNDRWAMVYLLSYSRYSSKGELDSISAYLKTISPALSEVIDSIRSQHITTKGQGCLFYENCHFFNSARSAHHAQVIIANHSLVFNWPNHLPKIRGIIFDEAHHLEDQITKAYSVELSESSISETFHRAGNLAASIVGLKLTPPFHDEPAITLWNGTLSAIKSRLFELRTILGSAFEKRAAQSEYEVHCGFTDADIDHPVGVAFQNLHSQVKKLNDLMTAVIAAFGEKQGKDIDSLKGLSLRYLEFSEKLERLIQKSDSDELKNFLKLVYWNAPEKEWRIQISPIDVSKSGKEFFTGIKSVILTSATLSTGVNIHFIPERVGLELSQPLLQLPSPYTLEKQAQVYLPNDIPPPGNASHFEALIETVFEVTTALKGRTLLLMTSNKRLKMAAEILSQRLEPHGITVFDSLTDRRAAENFKTSPHALLIGGEKYGEGLDIPGKALSCVIIEKMNEAMTRSPLAEARKAKTAFAIYDYDFPIRMMWLKQRVGRLIRSKDDTGAVIIFDSRYHQWKAGSKRFVDEALSPIPVRTLNREAIVKAVEACI